MCKQNHFIQNCSQFLKLTVKMRYEKAKSLGLCLNCLRKGNHISKECQFGTCRKCGQKHNTLLHYDKEKITDNSKSDIGAGQAFTTIENDNQVVQNNAKHESVLFSNSGIHPEVLL